MLQSFGHCYIQVVVRLLSRQVLGGGEQKPFGSEDSGIFRRDRQRRGKALTITSNLE